MDFGSIAVISLAFLAPLVAIFFFAWKGERAPGAENQASIALFTLAALVAVAGIVRADVPVKMEMFWSLTMEQSGYFEFSLQSHWARYVWIFFTGSLLLAFSAYDLPTAFQGERKNLRLLFLVGSFLFAELAFLSENILLSLMFVEIAAFLLHAIGMEAEGEAGEIEKSSYFKRSCFIFLGLVVMLGLALSHELSTGSVMLMGAVLYVLSTIFSKHNPGDWSQLPLLLVHLGMALFLLERVMLEEPQPELWLPLTMIFSVATILFALLSFLSSSTLGASFWQLLSVLGYLLYLRFSSARPTDPFWGAYEAVGLGIAYAIGTLFRFGERMDLLWKRALAFFLLALFLGILSGALPNIEAFSTHFDGETSVAKVVLFGILTFLVSAVSAKALSISLLEVSGKKLSPHAFLVSLAPALFLLAVHGGALARWSKLNPEGVVFDGFAALFYDPRFLVAATAAAAGLLAGGLLGRNVRLGSWTKNREKRMEDIFPQIDPAIVHWNLYLVGLPEQGIEWVSTRITELGLRSASLLDSLDRGFFGDRFFRGFSDYGSSLSHLMRYIHSGQARVYLFLGVLITLFSASIFLLEGR